MNAREIVRVIRQELERYRRLYRHAEQVQRQDPHHQPDRRERWYGAVRALERVLSAIFGSTHKPD